MVCNLLRLPLPKLYGELKAMTNRFQSHFENTPELQGRFLVAAPALEGTPFARTVVLVLQHNEQGAFGVILNRPANEQLKQSWRQVIGQTEMAEALGMLEHLQEGGPKGGPVIVLHPIAALGEMEVDPGVFISATSEIISKIIRSGDSRYRIYCGVASWTSKQLASELAQGLWYLMDGDSSIVFSNQEFIWEQSLLQYGRSILCDILNVKELPPDPSLN